MRVAWLGLALVGCRFGFNEGIELRADTSRAGPDTATPADIADAMIVGCNVPSTGAVACYPFDGNGTDIARQNDATTTAVSYDVGRVDRGALLGASSLIQAADSSAIHLTTRGTITAWIRVDALPAAGARSVIVDTNSYGMSVLVGGDIECFYTGVHHTFAVALAVGAWAHLACAYDGAAVTLWQDGAVVESQTDSGPIANSASGLQIGSNIPDPNHPNADQLRGMLDEVGVWSVNLTTPDVCAAAGC